MQIYDESVESLEKRFNTSVDGLTSKQAKDLLDQHGLNQLEQKKKESIMVKFFRQFQDPLIIILLIAAIVSLIVDPNEWLESLIIFIVVMLNALLGTIQENNAEKALDSLKKMSAPNAKVRRDGKVDIIPASEVVPGDIALIEAGDLIPSDGRIIKATSLKVDESSLTGESVPVEKTNAQLSGTLPLADQKNMVFASTIVTYGTGEVLITSTGMDNQIGLIAKQLDAEENSLTPLQLKLNAVSKTIGMLCIGICIVVFALEVIEGSPILDAFKSAVALAVAAVPEGLATVVTVLLAIGVKDMVKHNAIVKKLPAVETLGSTSVICSDKTGTLTQNKMTVTHYYLEGHGLSEIINQDVDPADLQLSEAFTLCSDAKGSLDGEGNYKTIGDPTETALLDASYRYGKTIADILGSVKLISSYPFDSSRKMMSVAIEHDGHRYIITKGSPDALFVRSVNDVANAKRVNENLADQALRVLALGYKNADTIDLDDLDQWECDLTFMGLVAMKDPIKPSVKDSIAIAAKAGVKTVMITGDSLPTAKAIARELNILDGSTTKAIDGLTLEAMDDKTLADQIEDIRVYARVSPSDKVRIVDAFQTKGEVVAMTGDGVNDSPALKRADIGCAMGITGTDVAKESADMILMDDNFTTIVASIKQGRTIYNNIEKDIRFLLSSNIGEVITIFLASLLSLLPNISFGIPLASIHLLWINLITDSLPAFAIGFEQSEPTIMDQKPRRKDESIFNKTMWRRILIEGVAVGLLTLGSYMLGHYLGGGSAEFNHQMGMTMAFVTLAMSELFHSFNVKSTHSIFNKSTFNNKWLNGAFVLGVVLIMVLIYTPLNGIFDLVALDFVHIIEATALAACMIVVGEIEKLLHI